MIAKINNLWSRFILFLAKDSIIKLEDRNKKLIQANSILYSKCNEKDTKITKLRSESKFEFNASIDTKFRVWIKSASFNESKNIMYLKSILSIGSKKVLEIEKSSQLLKYQGNKTINPLNKVDNKGGGLSKGYRRK